MRAAEETRRRGGKKNARRVSSSIARLRSRGGKGLGATRAYRVRRGDPTGLGPLHVELIPS